MSYKTTSPRVGYLRRRHSGTLQLLAAIQEAPARVRRREHGVFEIALASDPTPKALYLATVIRWLLSGTMRVEDARPVRDTLAAFHAVKRHLPVEKRDIGAYRTPGDVSATAGQFDDAAEAALPPDVRDRCPVEISGDGWAVYRVEDTGSAAWWADSTSWCTRHADSGARYLGTGPLHVLTVGKDKYQFHVATGDFRDRHDRPVTADMPVPAAAVEGILGMLAGQDGFRPVALQVRLEDILAARDPSRAVVRPAELDAVMRAPGTEGTADGGMILGRVREGRRSVAVAHVRGSDGVHVRETFAGEEILGALDRDSAPFVMLASASRNRRGGVRRCLEKLVAWASYGASGHQLVRAGGEDFLVWTRSARVGEGSGIVPRVELVDMAAPPGSRVHRIRAGDFDAAPERIRQAVVAYAERTSSLPAAAVAGRHNISQELRERLVSKDGKHAALWHLGERYRGDGYAMDIVSLAFAPDEREAVVRIARAADFALLSPRRREGTQVPTPEDFRVVEGVVGAGLWMVGVPDDLVDEETVDRLLDKGRLEVLKVLPARLLTTERLARAVGLEETTAMGVAGRSMSMDVLDRLRSLLEDPSARTGRRAPGASMLGALLAEQETYLTFKGLSHVGQAWRALPQEARDRNGPEVYVDDQCRALMAHPGGRAALDKAFGDLPPVAKPWPLVLEAMGRSAEGLDDVIASLARGGWRSPRHSQADRVADLERVTGTQLAERVARAGAVHLAR